MRLTQRIDAMLLALLSCAVVGIALIAQSAGSISIHHANTNAVAFVNGVPITRRAFNRAADLVHANQLGPPHALLEYLIDQEILVQHALEIGLLAEDPQLHRIVVRTTMDAAIRDAKEDVATDTNDWVRSASKSIAAIELEQCRISGVRRLDELGADLSDDALGHHWEASCVRL